MNIYDVNGALLLHISTPEEYGAVGDGVANDTAAIQAALNAQGLILCSATANYKVTDVLRIKNNTVLDLNGCTLTATYNHLMYNFTDSDTSFTGYSGNGNITIRNGIIIGGAISFAHGENILLENVQFVNSLNDHFLEIAGCKNYNIRGCSFSGMKNLTSSVLEYINLDHCRYQNFPWLPSGSAFYDNTPNAGVHVTGCTFSLGTGTYAYGYNAFGVHSVTGLTTKHSDISVIDSTILGFTGCGVRLNGMNNIFINNNRIQVAGDGIMLGDVGACDTIVIKGNYVTSVNGANLVKTADRYTNLTVVGNYTAGTIENF